MRGRWTLGHRISRCICRGQVGCWFEIEVRRRLVIGRGGVGDFLVMASGDGARRRVMDNRALLDALARSPLLSALFGRRSRRFGVGMSIPDGPMAYDSH